MNGDIERNLDTQARRLAEIDAAISAALDDEAQPVELPEMPQRRTYDHLTEDNDKLRTSRGWKQVDLDRAMTKAQLAAWNDWQTKHRLEWRTSDYLAVGAAGLVGFLFSWFDSSLDRGVRNRLKGMTDSPLVQQWEKAGKRLPIDYMGKGFGGRGHRIKSPGHDLARFGEAVKQVMSGEFRGVRWNNGIPEQIVKNNYVAMPIEDAVLALVQHLLADLVTEMSLPIPGMSYLREMDSDRLRMFAEHAYGGLRPGEGINIRSGIAMPTIPVLIAEVLIRTYIHAEAYATTGSAMLDWPAQRRRTELLLGAHGLVAAISVGKTAAVITAHSLTGTGLRALHPGTLRHINIPALVRTGTLAATVVADGYRASQIPGAKSWDDLVLETAQPWQLNLVDQFEVVGETVAADLNGLS